MPSAPGIFLSFTVEKFSDFAALNMHIILLKSSSVKNRLHTKL